jgi:hypothetical protein
MRKKSSVDDLFNPCILGKSVQQAKMMVRDDRICKRRGLQNEKRMKKQGITVAGMAGFMH